MQVEPYPVGAPDEGGTMGTLTDLDTLAVASTEPVDAGDLIELGRRLIHTAEAMDARFPVDDPTEHPMETARRALRAAGRFEEQHGESDWAAALFRFASCLPPREPLTVDTDPGLQ